MRIKYQILIISATLAGSLVGGAGLYEALGGSVSCGAVLTSDVTLESDLNCSGGGAALVIGADHVTVDLNGHTLSGDAAGIGIDDSGGFAHVSIKNGTITAFAEGIRAVGASHLTLGDLILTRSGWNVHLADSDRVEVRNVAISGEFESTYGIVCESVAGVGIKETTINGCQIGIEFGSCGLGPDCPPIEAQLPTTGLITGSEVADCFVGIGLANTEDATVQESVVRGCAHGIRVTRAGGQGYAVGVRLIGNDISGNAPFGILAHAIPPPGTPLPLPLYDLQIKENRVHDNVRGVVLVNVQDSKISENEIGNNAQFGLALFETSSGNHVADNLLTGNGTYGMLLIPVLGDAERPGPTGNRITGNIATENGLFDLFHSATSTPNAWKDNSYNTKSGADIP